MSLLISVNKIQKTMGSKTLFEDLSFGINRKEKIGLIGPNGSGKSTLIKILSGKEEVEAGELNFKKNLGVALVEQDTFFDDQISLEEFIAKALQENGLDLLESQVQASIALSMAGFEDVTQKVGVLSGGWKKRLAIARALAQEPELLLLDEPTNHMDWDGIFWLEQLLKNYKETFVLISHDRRFLSRVTNRTIEINPLYSEGYLSFHCEYEKFLEEKERYIQAQLSLQEVLSNKARREVEWLRAGVKARTTKSRSRMNEAHQLLDHLEQVQGRNKVARQKTRLEIDSTERKTKKLLDFKNVNVGYNPKQPLVADLNLTLGPKSCLGLLGNNGVGKTTLLKSIINNEGLLSGEVFKAEDLKIIYFDQKRQDLPQDINLMEFLGDGSGFVNFKNESVHVASYASRFLFAAEKMQLKISQLSGGEQSRLLIAKILLQPADVLILDEPTNDLDIETIEILEQTLQQFEGLVLLVSHDRKFLENLCDKHLALNGSGSWAVYASVEQWIAEQRNENKDTAAAIKINETKKEPQTKVKLSYKEKQQWNTIEDDIAKAEQELEAETLKLQNPDLAKDHQKLSQQTEIVKKIQDKVDQLYATWQELETKMQQLKKN